MPYLYGLQRITQQIKCNSANRTKNGILKPIPADDLCPFHMSQNNLSKGSDIEVDRVDIRIQIGVVNPLTEVLRFSNAEESFFLRIFSV